MNKIEKIPTLYNRIAEIIEQARTRVATAVNLTMVYSYFEIGRYIVEDEQQGEQRAEYGKSVLKELSARLTERFGEGYSYPNLKNIRQFYLLYEERAKRLHTVYPFRNSQKRILQTVSKELQTSENKQIEKHETLSRKSQIGSTVFSQFTLSWSHYRVLMRIENPAERNFYEIEATQQNWSVRQLQKQHASSLYERLAIGKNKEELMRLANEGQIIEKPEDILKNPINLGFLGLKEQTDYTETMLEQRILSNLQDFLLEMGKGFLFEARQKRFTFDEDNFYVDLVLYNRLLRSYVLIDLKIDKLQHQDLGQMQMYVNYYDRYVKQDFENPTIGIVLCKTANQLLVELTLPENSNVYAAQYALYLPEKTVLQQKLNEWTEEFDNEIELKKIENQ